jgi:hypothetical protein
MTTVENKFMMILMRLTLLDSASSLLSGPSGTAQQHGQCEQHTKIAGTPSPDASHTLRERANDRKPS